MFNRRASGELAILTKGEGLQVCGGMNPGRGANRELEREGEQGNQKQISKTRDLTGKAPISLMVLVRSKQPSRRVMSAQKTPCLDQKKRDRIDTSPQITQDLQRGTSTDQGPILFSEKAKNSHESYVAGKINRAVDDHQAGMLQNRRL